MSRFRSSSPEETRELGRQLAGRLGPDAVLLLHGDLGAGKTVLTQGLAAGLGLTPEDVQSPSYTLIREHGVGAERLIHVDLYRLEAGDLPALGLEEILAGPGLKVVEWAERIDFPVADAWSAHIRRSGPDETRWIEVREPKTTEE